MLTLHAADIVLPISAPPIPDGAVLVRDGVIEAVGPREELAAREPAARARRWPGVLTPGLVNAHSHLQYTDFSDLATSGLPFPEWIVRLTERRAGFTEQDWRESTRRGAHLMLRSGTTSAADIVTDTCVLPTLARSGLGGIAYVEAVAEDDRSWGEGGHRAALLATLDAAPAGLAVGVSPHTPFTLGTAVYRDCVQIARKRGLRLHPHLAETAAEVRYTRTGDGPLADSMRRFGLDFELLASGGAGMSPTAYLDSLGALGPDAHQAHGVHCDAADRALLRERGSAVALCPRSNRILAAGEPPIAAYLTEGSPIALGTDSLASSPSLDLWDEARAARELARRQGYTGDDLDRRLVEAATAGGAAALGLAVSAGALRAGARADLAVFDVPLDGTAADNPYTALVEHAAGHCVATVLAGRLVHRAA